MDVVQEIVYIIGGLAFLNCLAGFHQLIVSTSEEEPVSLSYFILALLSPFVIWQFIIGFGSQLGQLSQVEYNIQYVSFITLLPLSGLVALSLMLFPVRKNISKLNNNEIEFRKHIKQNRRLFFFFIFYFIVSLTLCDVLLNKRPGLLITITRYIMSLYSGFATIASIVVSENEIIYRFRLPTFRIKQGNFGSVIKKDHGWFILRRKNHCSEDEAKKMRKDAYDAIDRSVIFIITIGFVFITLYRFTY